MKPFSFAFLLIIGFNNFFAQHIDSVKMEPLFPTSQDSITLVIFSRFGSACYLGSHEQEIIGNSIYSYGTYCLAAASVICYAKDTLHLGVLPAGFYNIKHILKTGSGDIPCPNGVTVDSISFPLTVENYVGLDDIKTSDLFLFPNPTGGKINLSANILKKINELSIFNSEGVKLIEFDQVHFASGELDLSALESGIYFVELQLINNKLVTKKLIIIQD